MSDYLIKGETLTEIANAIRTKTGKAGSIATENMAAEILSIGEGLPGNYQKVEYIETSGTQFIQTGFRPIQASRVVLDWELVDALSGINSTIMGTIDNTGRQQGNWQLRQGGMISVGSLSTSPNIGEIPNGNIDMRYGTVIINDRSVSFQTGTYSQPNYGLILGGLLTNGALNTNALISMKIKEFSAYGNATDTEPTVHLIPCYEKTTGNIGMYDLIGRSFHANAGTGTFTKGADVN